jgi:ADP-ribosylglycohydrolase
LTKAIDDASESPPADYLHQQGWVVIAFQNALWQLLHAASLEDGVVDTVMRGGDTDTNAAIAGALLGAVYGHSAIPAQWVDKLLSCRPEAGRPNVRHPRPECFWPVDVLKMARYLVAGGELQEARDD